MTFLKNGGAYWQAQIDAAAHSENRQITLSGNWEIEQTIRIPSDFTLYLEDCHLKMAEGTFCNMFRNAGFEQPGGNRSAGADRDIRILGRGRAVLDGGIYNGLHERNSGKDGNPHISVNNLILFVNVDGFEITGIRLQNQRWWAINLLFCRHGSLRHIDFCSNDGIAGRDGSRIPGKTLADIGEYPGHEAYIRNSDGIDLRTGCHDIRIEDITGFTQDDTVALTGLPGKLEEMYRVEDLSTDIYNVIIRNVNSASFCTNIRLLNQGGIRLYNILIDGMTDASAGSPHMDRGIYGVRVGDRHMYGPRHSTPDETFNITIRNVYSRAHVSAVQLAGSITNCVLDNINAFDGCPQTLNNEAQLY